MAERRPASVLGTAIRCTGLGIRQYAQASTPHFEHHSAISILYA